MIPAIKTVICGAILGVATTAQAQAQTQRQESARKAQNAQPSVLLIITDQLNASVMGCQGHSDARTPNLDAMAARGTLYNRAYSPNAVSGPARMSLITGLYPRTSGCMENGPFESTPLKESYPIQAAFGDNGYTTYMIGKFHLFGNGMRGWDNLMPLSGKEGPGSYNEWVEKQGQAREFGEDWAAEFGVFPTGNSLAGEKFPKADMGTRTTKLRPENTMEAYVSMRTIEVLRSHAASGKPFFCYTSLYRPHQPYTPLESYLKNYDYSRWGKGTRGGDAIAKPATLEQPVEHLPPLLQNWRRNQNGIWCLGRAATDNQLYRNYIASYYALVEEIDYWIGEIFSELDRSGLAENTIVIFTSDHGDFVGSHGMIEKCATGHNVYEATLRIPLIFVWDKHVRSGAVAEDLTGLLDIYPTLADMCHLKMPEMKWPLSGVPLTGSLTRGKKLDREYIVSENWSQATVIVADCKLGKWLEVPETIANRDFRSFGNMIFDRRSDPEEVNNIYGDKKYVAQTQKLEAYYADFVAKTSDRGKQERWTREEASKNKKPKK
ncbi:phosphonate monoester hydrolase [Bacteroidia bacterium]|nr:phosphonate monoester hydrolase [Bacteroidia bacterium]